MNVAASEYRLAVNGRDLHASDEIYSLFQETVGKQVALKVGPNPDGSTSREVTVVPVEDERGLRNLAWIEGNRRMVDELTGVGSLTFICRTRPEAATPTSTATSSRRLAGRQQSSTSASITAATSRITSLTT